MVRLQPEEERLEEKGVSVEVKGHDKTDARLGWTWTVIRSLKDRRLSPYYHHQLLKEGAKKRGVSNTIWCSDNGVPIVKSDRILRLLKELLRAAGIMEPYTANSIRHAMITTLCQLKGVGEKRLTLTRVILTMLIPRTRITIIWI
jgi:hypothetical protein